MASISSNPPTSRSRSGGPTTLAVVCLATAMLMVDLAVTAVAVRQIAVDLGAGLDDVQWVLVGYSATMGSLILLAASLSDRLGRRRVFGAGAVVFTLASVLCAVAPNPLSLNLFRVLHGVGGALLFAPVVPLLAAAYPGAQRQRVIGLWSAVAGLSGMCGPLLGGLLVDGLGWRSVFWINVPIGVVVVSLLGRLPVDPPAVRGRPDVLGGALLVAALLAVNLALTLGADGELGSPLMTVGGPVVGLALLALFLARQSRRADPLLDPRLFARRQFAGICGLAFLTRMGTVGLLVFLMVYLQWGQGLGAGATAVALLPMFVGMMPGALAAPRLLERFAASAVIATGAVVSAVGCLLLAGALCLSSEPPASAVLGIGLALWGFGGGLAQTPLPGLATAAVPLTRVGMATGAVNSLMPIGTAFGGAVLGLIFTPAAAAALGSGDTGSRSDLLARLPDAAPEVVTRALGVGLGTVTAVAAGVLLLAAGVAVGALQPRSTIDNESK